MAKSVWIIVPEGDIDFASMPIMIAESRGKPNGLRVIGKRKVHLAEHEVGVASNLIGFWVLGILGNHARRVNLYGLFVLGSLSGRQISRCRHGSHGQKQNNQTEHFPDA